MRSIVATLTFGVGLIVMPAKAQYIGNWSEGDHSKARIGFKPDFPDAADFKAEVFTRPNGDQRDHLLMGGHDVSSPGPIAWIIYHTSRYKFGWSGGIMDTVYSLAPPFINQKARMSSDGRENLNIKTGLSGGLEEIEAIKGTVTFSDGKVRECVSWRGQSNFISATSWGYYCSAVGQSLDVVKFQQTMSAVILRK